MPLLKKLKSLFGLDDEPRTESSRDVGVTVEKERQAESAADATPEADDESTAAAVDAAGSESTSESDAATADETDAETESATAEDGAPEAAEAESEPVQDIKGIGPAYAERLGNVDVHTVADLAAADAESIAAETDISETRVEEWVNRAKARQ